MKQFLILLVIATMTACSTSDDSARTANPGVADTYTIVVDSGPLQPNTLVRAPGTFNFVDGPPQFFEPEYNDDTNSLVIESRLGVLTSIEVNLYIASGHDLEVYVYNSSGDLLDSELINEYDPSNSYTYTYEVQ